MSGWSSRPEFFDYLTIYAGLTQWRSGRLAWTVVVAAAGHDQAALLRQSTEVFGELRITVRVVALYRREARFDHRVEAPRQLLHAHTLAFKHPSSGEELEFEAPLPKDFREALRELRRGCGRHLA